MPSRQIRTRMLHPIPHDWDNETWFSMCVQWPDSIHWRSLFWSSIQRFAKGRIWDETTGNVKSAQEIGKEIYYRNLENENEGCLGNPDEIRLEYLNWLLDCLGLTNVAELPVTCEDVTQIFAICECDEGEDCMANVTNLRCTDDGWLEMERCCQWVRVCYIGNISGSANPDNPGIEQDYKCNFSGAFARHIIIYRVFSINEAIHNNLFGTDQQIVDIIKAMNPQMSLNSIDLFSAIRRYRLDSITVYDEILNFAVSGNEELIRCLLYNAIKNQPTNSPAYVISPTEVALFITAISTYGVFSQSTKDVLYYLLRAINFTYIKSSLGNYTELAFECSCGALPPLSSASGEHTADLWYLSAGLEGSFEQSDPDEEMWPECQWCKSPSEINPDPSWEWYGVAFTVYQSSASQMIRYHNPTKPVSCTADYQFTTTTPAALIPGGKYIICHPTMYGYLAGDAAEYTLISDAGYSIIHGSGKPNADTGFLSLRNALNNTPWTAFVRDFRFIFSGLDV